MGEEKRRRDAGGLQMVAVGRPVPDEWRRAIPHAGGGALGLARTHAMIMTGFPGMTDAEAAAARRAPLEIGLLPFGDALFAVVHIDGYATLDLPYDHGKPPPGVRGLPDREPHQGLLFHLVAFDTVSGILRGQRMVSVTPQFSDVLSAQVGALDRRVGAGDWHYDDDLRRAYARWPGPDHMLASAVYRETAGMPFPGHGTRVPPPPGAH